MVTPICEIINLIEPATTLTFWECVREYWIQFQQNRKAAQDFAGPIRGREETPEAEAERKSNYRACMKHAETFRKLALDTMTPFWRAYQSIKTIRPTILSRIPILSDDSPATYEPRTLALAVQSVRNALLAEIDSGIGNSDSPGVEREAVGTEPEANRLQGGEIDSQYAELVEFANGKLKFLQKNLLLLIISRKGGVLIDSLPSLLNHYWSDPKQGYNDTAKKVNEKIRKLGWRLGRRSNAACLVKLEEDQAATGGRKRAKRGEK